MSDVQTWTLPGVDGDRHAVKWTIDSPRFVVLLAHGYGEHSGRYEHVAGVLTTVGGCVYALDHVGHGRSAGEPAVVTDFDDVITDLHTLDEHARTEYPGLPVALIGHSMGGMIATRYAQAYGDTLAALVLSGPQVAGAEMLEQMLALPEIPEFPIDPSVLSRDPAVGEAYMADPLVWHGGMKREMAEAMVRSLAALTAGPRITTPPVLWLHGSEDQLSPLAMARPVIEAVVTGPLDHQVYAGAQHEIFNETNKDEVLATVVNFIERTLAS